MNRPLLIGTALICGFGTGCPAGRDSPPALWPGEISFVVSRSWEIEHAGSLLFQNSYGSTIYSVDVSDPVRPESTDYDAYGAIACNTGCDDFVVIGGNGFLLNATELAIVGLPDAALPTLIHEFDDPSDWSAYDMTVLPGPALAIARAASTSGEILVFDLSSGDFQKVRTIPTDYRPVQVVSDGQRLFSYTWIGYDPRPNEVVVYDASVLTSAQEIARVTISLPGELALEHLAISGKDLFVLSTRDWPAGGDEGDFLGWYRFSDDFTALIEMATTTSYSPVAIRPRFLGRHVVFENIEFLPDDVILPEAIVLSLDTNYGFVETSRAFMRWAIATDIDIDEDRGLVYLGGQGLQIYDFGILTGGTARWPTASTPEGASVGLIEPAL